VENGGAGEALALHQRLARSTRKQAPARDDSLIGAQIEVNCLYRVRWVGHKLGVFVLRARKPRPQRPSVLMYAIVVTPFPRP
jgi:CRISPR/Cas system Type II protein with McrA/HNH and RuvC-like nuclease domain